MLTRQARKECWVGSREAFPVAWSVASSADSSHRSAHRRPTTTAAGAGGARARAHRR